MRVERNLLYSLLLSCLYVYSLRLSLTRHDHPIQQRGSTHLLVSAVSSSSSPNEYADLIKSLAVSDRDDAADRTEEAFNLYLRSGESPRSDICTLLLEVLGKDNPIRAERAFDRISLFLPDEINVDHYHALIRGWGMSGRLEASRKVKGILEQMQFAGIEATEETYKTIIRVNSSRLDAIRDNGALLISYFDKMLTIQMGERDINVYREVLDKLTSTNDPEVIETFTRRLVSDVDAKELRSKDFESCVYTWSRSDRIDAPGRLLDLFSLMRNCSLDISIELHTCLIVAYCSTTNIMYNKTTRATNSGIYYLQQAILSLKHLRQSYSGAQLIPAADSIIKSGCYINDSNLHNITTEILRLDIIPTLPSIEAVISHVAMSHVSIDNVAFLDTLLMSLRGNDEVKDENYMFLLLTLQFFKTYNEFYASQQSSPSIVTDKLQLMCISAETTATIDRCVNSLLLLMERNHTIPEVTYDSFFLALNKSSNEKLTDSGMQVFQKMTLEPSSLVYSVLLSKWCSSSTKDAPEQAQAVLDRMKSFNRTPTLSMYESLLQCWSFSTLKTASSKIEAIINAMKEAEMVPTLSCDNSLLRCWLRSKKNDSSFKIGQIVIDMKMRNIELGQETLVLLAEALAQKKLPSSVTVDDIYHGIVNVTIKSKSPIDPIISTILLTYWSEMIHIRPAETHDEVLGKVLKLLVYMCSSRSTIYTIDVYDKLFLLLQHYTYDTKKIVNLMKKLNMKGSQLLIPYNIILASLPPDNLDNGLAQFAMEKNLVPDTLSFNIMLDRLSKLSPKDALVKYKEYKELFRMTPNAETIKLTSRLFRYQNYTNIEGYEKLREMFKIVKNPSYSSYVAMIEFLCSSSVPNSIDIASEYISMLISSNDGTASTYLADLVISAWMLKGAVKKAAFFFDTVLLPNGIVPRIKTYKQLLYKLSQSSASNAAETIESLLARLPEVDDQMLQSFFICLSSKPEAANNIERAERVFTTYVIEKAVRPTTILMNCLLDIYSKSKFVNAPEMCEDVLLTRFQELDLEPDYISYNAVISAWAKSRNKPFAFERAHIIFEQAIHKGIKMTAVSYTSLLSALWRSRKDNAAELSSTLFSSMVDQGIMPDLHAWTTLIGIWSKKDTEKTQQLFDAMVGSGFQPNNVTYTTLLNMWGSSTSPMASIKIYEIFKNIKQQGQKLDTIAYSSLLSALSSSNSNDPYLAERAIEIFENMKSSGFKPDVQAFSILIGILAKNAYNNDCFNTYLEIRKNGLQPTAVTFSIILSFLNRSKHENAKSWLLIVYSDMMTTSMLLDGQCIRSLYYSLLTFFSSIEAAEKMNMLVTKILNYGVEPDALSFATVFRSWLRVDDVTYAIDKMTILFNHMLALNIQPCAVVYTAILKLIGKSNDEDKEEKIMSYLNSYRNGNNVESTPVVYNTILELYETQARNRALLSPFLAIKTRKLVDMMIKVDRVRPDTTTLLTTLTIYNALSHLNNIIVTEAQVLDKMIRDAGDVAESMASLHLLLAAWSKCQRHDVLVNVEETFKRIALPNSHSYYYLFKSYSKLKSDKMTPDIIRRLFFHYKWCLSRNAIDSKVFAVFLSALERTVGQLELSKSRMILKQVLASAVTKHGLVLDPKYHIPKIAAVLHLDVAAAFEFCEGYRLRDKVDDDEDGYVVLDAAIERN